MTTRKTTRKAAPKVDPEVRRAEMDALHDRLVAAVDALTSSEQWTRYLSACASFHHYSMNNILLILSQCPEATRVAGYRTWQKVGRQVTKGQKSIRILGGRTVTVDDPNDPDNGKTFVRYFPCSVFDQSQTELMEGAEDVLSLNQRLEGDDPAAIYERTAAWLSAQGWDVGREAIPGEVNGYTVHESRTVRVDDSLSPAQAAKTMLHEAAHAILHGDREGIEKRRAQVEVEAESVAYVVALMLGLDTSDYSIGYVAGWSQGDREILGISAAAVLDASHTLADALGIESAAAAA